MVESKKSVKSVKSTRNVKVSPKKNIITPALSVVSGIALAGLTGLAARKIMRDKQISKINRQMDEIPLNTVDNCQERMKILNDSLEKEIEKLKEQIKYEQSSNIKLVDQIKKCNNEVVRQTKIISRKPSLLKEASMRAEVNRLHSFFKKASTK